MATDTDFLNRILLACGRGATRLFRNSVGLGWVGKSTRFTAARTIVVSKGDVLVRAARPLHAGLFKGSGDLIGWRVVKISPEMVGQEVAIFVSLEAKEGSGRSTPEQKQWAENVRAAGGLAAEVRSVDDAVEALGGLDLFASSQ